MGTTRQVILASQSPQRRVMMETLGVPFQAVPAHLDELAITAPTQVERAAAVALAKAQTIAALYPNAVVLAGDTYVLFNDTALEKPRSLEEALQMLRTQSGQQLVAVTGVAYLDPEHHIVENTTIQTEFAFRELSEAEIERYVTTEPVVTWSAAFCPAYATGAALVAHTNGSFTSFTHGFPLEFFVPLLQRSGVVPYAK
jgi:septum formation protein